MRLRQLSKDIFWTPDGDLFFDSDKEDIYLTGAIEDEILHTSVVKRLSSTNGQWSERGDWRYHPEIGNDLYKYIGSRHTRLLLDELRNDISSLITSDNLVAPDDLSVEVVPIGPYTLLVLIFCSSLIGAEPILVSFDFALMDHQVATVTDPLGRDFKSHLKFRNVE